MQRRAFLIGGDYKKPGDYLSGISADIAAWKRYLMSSCGGCWTRDEIVDLSGSSKEYISAMLQAGRTVDYSLVCFAGHGYLAKDNWGFNVTKVWINDGVEMSERELNPGSPWCMQIFDCCRKGLENEKVAFSNEALNASFQHNTRALFENELLKCERGLVTVYAAGEGEGAADVRSFSRVLMGVSKDKVGASTNGVLHIDEAVRFANAEMPPQQNPVYKGGRRLHHFPFAVMSRMIYS